MPETVLAETGTTTITAVESVSDVTNDLALVAENAEQMQVAQQQLAAWFASKKQILSGDLVEVEQELAIAEHNGWRTAGFKRQAGIIRKRIDFYEKCRQASEAGYCIVPNLPCDIFAVRTTRALPRADQFLDSDDARAQRSDSPPAGEGEYVDDQASIRRREHEWRDDKGQKRSTPWFHAVDFADEIDFPIAICKPRMMDAAARAMALKVFDEVAVVDDQSGRQQVSTGMRRGDPLLVGIIRDPRRTTYDDKRVTFLIGWYVDTSVL